MELLLTLDCNHRCDYCFVHGKQRDRDMPLSIAEQALHFLMAASGNLSSVNVLPFGGEPLLRFDLLRELVDYGRAMAQVHNPSKTIAFSLTTNGTLLDEEKMLFFRDRGIMVLLSLDGDRNTHDRHRHIIGNDSSYLCVAQKVPMIKHFQPWLGTRMTVHPDSAKDLLGNFEHLITLGINQFIIGPATGTPWTDEQWATYEQQLIRIMGRYARLRRGGAQLRLELFERDVRGKPGGKRGIWGCGAGKGRITVSPNGDLYPCSKLLGIDALRDTHKLGDVWAGLTHYKMRGEFLAAGEDERAKCRECEVKDDCDGGCPATNYEETGSLFEPSWLDCKQTRLMVRLRSSLKEFGDVERPGTEGFRHIRAVA
jgi:uncharacterized protein